MARQTRADDPRAYARKRGPAVVKKLPSETPLRRKQHDDDDDDDDDVDDDGEYDDGGEGGKEGGGSIASTRGAGRLGHRRASRHATLLSLAARARRACAP